MKLTPRRLRQIIQEELNLFEDVGAGSPYRTLTGLVMNLPRPESGERLPAAGVQDADIQRLVRGLPGPQPSTKTDRDPFDSRKLFVQVANELIANGWQERDVMIGITAAVERAGPRGVLGDLFRGIAASPQWRDTAKAGLEWALEAVPKGGFIDKEWSEGWKRRNIHEPTWEERQDLGQPIDL